MGVRPFSENISTGDRGIYSDYDKFLDIPSRIPEVEPNNVKRAFAILRKVYRPDEDLPSYKEFENAKKILVEWRKTLGFTVHAHPYPQKTGILYFLKRSGVTPKTARRIENALAVKHPGGLAVGKKPAKLLNFQIKKTLPTKTEVAKAEKIVQIVAKDLGKPLSKVGILKLAMQITPYLKTVLLLTSAINLAQRVEIKDFVKKFMSSKDKNNTQYGEFYHKDVGWY